MGNNEIVIKQVWKGNLDAEMSIIMDKAVVNSYSFVSLTTHLLLCEERIPAGTVWGDPDVNYLALLGTTDRFMNIVKVGLAACDEDGDLPRCGETGRRCIWEFNLKPLEEGAGYLELEEFLEEFCGRVTAEPSVRRERIDPELLFDKFQYYFLLGNKDINWVMFKGGLDFMALLRFGLRNFVNMPIERQSFLRLLTNDFFPVFYDVAAVVGSNPVAGDGTIDGSARSIGVRRENMPLYGTASDSLLALRMFMKMKMVEPERLEEKARVLFGITSE